MNKNTYAEENYTTAAATALTAQRTQHTLSEEEKKKSTSQRKRVYDFQAQIILNSKLEK